MVSLAEALAKPPSLLCQTIKFFLVSLVLVLERWGLVSFNQVEFYLESWKKEFQPKKNMVILNSTLLIS
jgi:hypothetical protein